MISPISNDAVQTTTPPTANRQQTPPTKHQEPQDTVQLSQQAKTSLDADHDGDNH